VEARVTPQFGLALSVEERGCEREVKNLSRRMREGGEEKKTQGKRRAGEKTNILFQNDQGKNSSR